ncbi:hypothetical protein [Microvirga sp. P5_D2]
MDKAADFAELIQSMRKLMWKSAFLARDDEEGCLPSPESSGSAPRRCAPADRMRPVRPDLASERDFLADALAAGPRVPTEDKLVRRYVRGEIGERTVQWITGRDQWQLMGECLVRGLPSMQSVEDSLGSWSNITSSSDKLLLWMKPVDLGR